MYAVMSEFFELIDFPVDNGPRVREMGEKACDISPLGSAFPLDLSALRSEQEQQKAWEFALEHVQKLARTPDRSGTYNTGPILPHSIEAVRGIPALLPAGPPLILAGNRRKIEIPVGMTATALHFFGHATYFDGFPVRGVSGETIGRYVVCYEDDTDMVVPLRNGIEMASASMIAITSRIDPAAVAAERVLVITVDPDWEVYQVNRFIIPVDPEKTIRSVVFESLDSAYYPLLYGVTAAYEPPGKR